ncbi:MAG: DUF1501 domain-containing protein, partial [Planctomycetota bacterium]
MDPILEQQLMVNRRQLFGRVGVGAMALASILPGATGIPKALAARSKMPRGSEALGGLPGLPHFQPKAKRIIYLFQSGGPAHIDLLDYKPNLQKWHGKELPESIRKNHRNTTMTAGQSAFPVAASKFKFTQHGQNGTWFSEPLK